MLGGFGIEFSTKIHIHRLIHCELNSTRKSKHAFCLSSYANNHCCNKIELSSLNLCVCQNQWWMMMMIPVLNQINEMIQSEVYRNRIGQALKPTNQVSNIKTSWSVCMCAGFEFEHQLISKIGREAEKNQKQSYIEASEQKQFTHDRCVYFLFGVSMYMYVCYV